MKNNENIRQNTIFKIKNLQLLSPVNLDNVKSFKSLLISNFGALSESILEHFWRIINTLVTKKTCLEE